MGFFYPALLKSAALCEIVAVAVTQFPDAAVTHFIPAEIVSFAADGAPLIAGKNSVGIGIIPVVTVINVVNPTCLFNAVYVVICVAVVIILETV